MNVHVIGVGLSIFSIGTLALGYWLLAKIRTLEYEIRVVARELDEMERYSC